MSKLLIVEPLPILAATSSRGTGAEFLATRDPKEVWADAASGSPATLTIDLGVVRAIDTILLGAVRPPAATATWAISAGVASSAEFVVQPQSMLRVPDVAGEFAERTHALWRGLAINARRLSIAVTQPAGAPPLTAGILVAGMSFAAELGQEWGAGKQPIDTGSATALPSGGFAIVEGVRKRLFNWTFGDLSRDETDRLERIALALGTTSPGVVIEDAERSAGLRGRIHYGLFQRWRAYERRNRRQTRWELGIEDWV